MRIGVDARPLAGRRTGIGHYLAGLLAAFAARDAGHEVILYAHRPIEFASPPNHWRVEVHHGMKGTGPIWLQLHGARLARRDRIDLYWGAHFLLPLGLPRSMAAAVTVYDLVPFLFPHTMEVRNYLVTRLLMPRSLARAQRIMVISQSVAAELRDIFPAAADRLSVVPPGVRPEFFRSRDPAEIARRMASIGVHRPYVLTVGTVEPRKNLQTLFRAWRAVPPDVRGGTILVVAGSQGWKSSNLYAEARPLIDVGAVKLLGYVADADLPWLYAGARAFVFPTLYEGFGMPVVEALASGVPVIGSDIPVVREVAGDAAVYVAPTEVSEWAGAIRRLLTTPWAATDMQALGRQQAARYTFERSAALLLDVFEGLGTGTGVPADGATRFGR